MKLRCGRALAGAAAAAFIAMAVWQTHKPLPPGTHVVSSVCTVGAGDVALAVDLTAADAYGRAIIRQGVFDEVLRLVRSARHVVVLDYELLGTGEGAATPRRLSGALHDAPPAQRREHTQQRVLLITDPVNERYGTAQAAELQPLRAGGVEAGVDQPRCAARPGFLYSSAWRLTLHWWGRPRVQPAPCARAELQGQSPQGHRRRRWRERTHRAGRLRQPVRCAERLVECRRALLRRRRTHAARQRAGHRALLGLARRGAVAATGAECAHRLRCAGTSGTDARECPGAAAHRGCHPARAPRAAGRCRAGRQRRHRHVQARRPRRDRSAARCHAPRRARAPHTRPERGCHHAHADGTAQPAARERADEAQRRRRSRTLATHQRGASTTRSCWSIPANGYG